MNKNLVISAFMLATLSACGTSQNKDNTATSESVETVVRAKRVEVGKSKLEDVEQKSTFSATIEANIVNQISPQSPLRISKINVEVGDKVRAGQRLVELDAVNLEQARLRKENAEIEFKRIDELYKIGGESKSLWDSRKLELDIAVKSYNNLLENTVLISPISGIVTARNYDVGDMTSQPVLVVEQIAPVKMLINVSEKYFSIVKKGMELDIVLDAYKDEEFKGKISLIYPTIDSQTRTFQVEILITNKDMRIRPGMFARATLSFGTESNVVVPDQAVVKQLGSGDKYVYSIVNGKMELNKVELGQRMGDRQEILSGLEPDAVVVISGHSGLNSGDVVEIVNK